MKVDNKEFFKLSFLYTAVAALPPVLNLFVRPLIEGENKLTPVDFSQIEIAETIISFSFIIATFAMSSAISRFYYDHIGNKNNFNKLISSVFSSILLRGLLLFIVAFIFRNQIGKLFSQPALQDFSSYGFTAIAVGLFRAINVTAFALFRNDKKVRLYLIIGLLLGFLRSGFQLSGVFYYDMSFLGYISGSAVGNGIIAAIILIYIYNRAGFRFDIQILKPSNKFALPLFEYAFVVWGINFADRYFLEGTPNILGIYSQALLLGRGIEIIIQGIQGASQPEIFRLMKDGIEKNAEEIKKISHLFIAQSQLLIAAAIIPAMLYCYVFKTDLRLASGLVAIIFIRYILRTQYMIFAWPVFFRKKTRNFLYLNLFVLAVNLILLYFLVPLWKEYGAIFAFFTSQIIQVTGIYLIQKRLVNISWNINKLLRFPFFIIAIAAITEFIKIKMGINPFVTATVVVLSISGSLGWLYKNEIRGIVKKLKRRNNYNL
ncbi:MAG: oligosaccharide flippase family protein [Bacteroidales bacterium]|nr:oligosaccharide flippase family protein [Bacteroidales bacterium]